MRLRSRSEMTKSSASRRCPAAIDLFCGAGGLTAGLIAAGFRVVVGVELDRDAAEVYRLNHPTVELLEGDVRAISGAALMAAGKLKRGELDLLAACPPCQGFSTLRTRNGARRNRDARNGLLMEVLRLVRSTRPRHVMLENVPALGRTGLFRRFVRGIEAQGYKIAWDVLDVADYGVPQRRRRLILVAARGCVAPVLPSPTGRRTVREAIGFLGRPEASDDPLHRAMTTHSVRVRKIIRAIPKNGGDRRSLPKSLQLPCHARTTGFLDVYGRMEWDAQAPTITSGCTNPSKGRFLHPTQNRAISLREAALLQTFPPDYRFPLAKGRGSIARMIGNALPPEFIRRHAEAIAVAAG